MKLADFDAFCAALPGSTRVVQWGNSHVHKVGAKVFAIGNAEAELYVVFKASALSFEILLVQEVAVRAPYLPRGGWVMVADGAMADGDLREYLTQSYRLIAAKLPKRVRDGLGR